MTAETFRGYTNILGETSLQIGAISLLNSRLIDTNSFANGIPISGRFHGNIQLKDFALDSYRYVLKTILLYLKTEGLLIEVFFVNEMDLFSK